MTAKATFEAKNRPPSPPTAPKAAHRPGHAPKRSHPASEDTGDGGGVVDDLTPTERKRVHARKRGGRGRSRRGVGGGGGGDNTAGTVGDITVVSGKSLPKGAPAPANAALTPETMLASLAALIAMASVPKHSSGGGGALPTARPRAVSDQRITDAAAKQRTTSLATAVAKAGDGDGDGDDTLGDDMAPVSAVVAHTEGIAMEHGSLGAYTRTRVWKTPVHRTQALAWALAFDMAHAADAASALTDHTAVQWQAVIYLDAGETYDVVRLFTGDVDRAVFAQGLRAARQERKLQLAVAPKTALTASGGRGGRGVGGGRKRKPKGGRGNGNGKGAQKVPPRGGGGSGGRGSGAGASAAAVR